MIDLKGHDVCLRFFKNQHLFDPASNFHSVTCPLKRKQFQTSVAVFATEAQTKIKLWDSYKSETDSPCTQLMT